MNISKDHPTYFFGLTRDLVIAFLIVVVFPRKYASSEKLWVSYPEERFIPGEGYVLNIPDFKNFSFDLFISSCGQWELGTYNAEDKSWDFAKCHTVGTYKR